MRLESNVVLLELMKKSKVPRQGRAQASGESSQLLGGFLVLQAVQSNWLFSHILWLRYKVALQK